MEEPPPKKPKVVDEGEDDLERLEPKPSSASAPPRPSLMNDGIRETPSSSVSSSFSRNERGPSTSSFPSSQRQDGSVLQQLLFSSSNSTTTNSPRTGFSGHAAASQQPPNQPSTFPHRNPMGGGVSGTSTMLPPQVAKTEGRQGTSSAQLQQRPPMAGYPTDAMSQQHFHQPQQTMGVTGGWSNRSGMTRGMRGGLPAEFRILRGQRRLPVSGMGRGAAPMRAPNGQSAMQRGTPHMQQRPQFGQVRRPDVQQPQVMNSSIMKAVKDAQLIMKSEDMTAQASINRMPGQMGARPQQQQPQSPGGAQQPMMPDQQMTMGDQAMNHHVQQQHLRQLQRQQGMMMANGMERAGVASAHPNAIGGGGGNPPGVAPVGGPPKTQPTPDQEKMEKIQEIQKQLVLLLHAHHCSKKARSQEGYSCTMYRCAETKELMQHITTCPYGTNCSDGRCVASRQILHHWMNCHRENCPVCIPIRNVQAVVGGQGGNRVSDRGEVEGPSMPQSGMGMDRGSAPPNHLGQPLPMEQHPQQLNPAGVRRMAMNGGDLSSSNPDSVAPIVGNARQHLPSDSNPNETQSANGGHRGNGERGGNVNNWPLPEPPTTNKNWHAGVTNDSRHHLVGSLVREIFPHRDPGSLHDQRVKDLIEHVRKLEKDVFESADGREQYWHLLAEKIYFVKSELREKQVLWDRSAEERIRRKRAEEARANGVAVAESSVSSEMPTRTEDVQEAGPSTSAEETSVSNGVTIKREETSPAAGSVTTGVGAGGWNPVRVKEEQPSTSDQSTQSESTSAQPSTSAPTPKEEPEKEETPPLAPAPECVFDVGEMRRLLEPVLDELNKCDDAWPFLVPVDPVALNIPDYWDIIKHPMDLSTILKKLQSGQYTNPWQFCDDIWLMFENAWLYNKNKSLVYKLGVKLSDLFVLLIDPVMRSLGYCCGEKRCFSPLALLCYGTDSCTIGRDQAYYCYETKTDMYGVGKNDEITYCLTCYASKLPEEGHNLNDDANDKSRMAPKNEFQLRKNNVIEWEPLENCKYCHKKWHTICALHDKKVYPEGFVCETCRKDKQIPLPENKFVAKNLPRCKLSDHLEERVNGFIERRLKGSEHHEVIIRVLSAVENNLDVKPLMQSKYCGDAANAFPEKFPYKTKAIFAFEVIDGVEVCFFGLHVQEYGSKCPAPNARRVYIAYLDSVHYFQPAALRTDVYHEILLGYMEYCRSLGYTMAHIWACPPGVGEDFIFHCHPTEQKVPKPKRLQDWYKKMLDKGVQEGCLVEYKDIYKQAKDDKLSSPCQLPYFEGDFWPKAIEEIIKAVNDEEALRKEEENVVDTEDETGVSNDNGKKKGSKSKTKNNLKKGTTKRKRKAGGVTGDEVTDRLLVRLEQDKEIYFTIRLVPQHSALALTAEIVDPDPLMSSKLMDVRDTLLLKARAAHWEFSSLRRAKYSTLCFAHALHVEGAKETGYTCNQCDAPNAQWHCPQCEDFDLCDSCKTPVGHPHELERMKSIVGGEGGAGDRIQSCIHSLVHACTCRDANCRQKGCLKMKRVVAHIKECKKRVHGSCAVCKQLISICCIHAKHCQKERCQVPFCPNIRQKLMEQKRSVSRKADMMMRRRMGGLSAAAADPSDAAAAGPSTSSAGASSMLSSPSSVSSKPSHNKKGGVAPSMSSSSRQSHSSPMGRRNSKFAGQAPSRSSYPPGVDGASVQWNQNASGVDHSSGMGVMGASSGDEQGGSSTQQYMGMSHPQPGMNGSTMGAYRSPPGVAHTANGGMSAGMIGGQPRPMHPLAPRQPLPSTHDPAAVAARDRQMRRQQQQEQQQRDAASMQLQQQWSAQAAPQSQFSSQMDQQGAMGQQEQQSPPMEWSKSEEDAPFR